MNKISRKPIILFFVWIVMFLVAMTAFPLFAQTGPSVKPQEIKPQEVKPRGYPVVLDNQTLYYIREVVKGFDPQERAQILSERIEAIAKDRSIPVSSVVTSDIEDPMTLITARDKLLMTVFEEDARTEGKTRHALADEYNEKLRQAISKYRKDYSMKQIFLGILYFLIATFFLIAFIYGINRFYRKVSGKTQSWAESKKVSIHIQSLELIQPQRIRMLLVGGMKFVRVFIFLFLVYVYIHLCLSFFPWTEGLSSQLLGYILVPLRAIGSAVWAQVPNLFFVVIIVAITWYVLKLMRLFFAGIEEGTVEFKGFDREWAQPTYKICRLLVLAFAAVVAFPYIPGSNTPAFKGVSIFLGVLFSIGSSSTLANILAGYMLTYRRVFKVGDRVKIGDLVGDVAEIRLQVIHLRTIKNEEITVPSSVVVNSNVINYSSLAKKHGLILHTSVTIGYDTPWRQVEALLLLAAGRTPGLLAEPPPFVLQTSLGDFYVAYELNVYTDKPNEMIETYSKLHRNIQDAFNEYGVQIMSPNYRGDPAQPKIVPKDQWYAAPAKHQDHD